MDDAAEFTKKQKKTADTHEEIRSDDYIYDMTADLIMDEKNFRVKTSVPLTTPAGLQLSLRIVFVGVVVCPVFIDVSCALELLCSCSMKVSGDLHLSSFYVMFSSRFIR